MSQVNMQLLEMLTKAADSLAETPALSKQAFTPMPQGAAVDPASGAPVDPAQGAPPAGDPAAQGAPPAGDPAQGMPPGAQPPPPPPGDPSQIIAALQQVLPQMLQQMGIGGQGGGQGAGKGKGGKSAEMEERISAIEGALAEIMQHMGLANPTEALAGAITQSAASSGFGPGSGQSSPGAGSAPAAAGPMDPAANEALGQVQLAQPGMKAAALDHTVTGGRSPVSLNNVRRTIAGLRR